MKHALPLFFLILALLPSMWSCKDEPDPITGTLQLVRARAGNTVLQIGQRNENLEVGSQFFVEFNSALDTASARQAIRLTLSAGNAVVATAIGFDNDFKTAVLTPAGPLGHLTEYKLVVGSTLKGLNKESFPGVEYALQTAQGFLRIEAITINQQPFTIFYKPKDITYDNVSIVIRFSEKLDPADYQSYFSFFPQTGFQAALSSDHYTVTITPDQELDYYKEYSFRVSSLLESAEGFTFSGFANSFSTGLNPTLKFPQLSDEELMTLVQQQTFRYFWDFAHPVSGLTRERNTSGETVTIGGSGFGVMAILVGIERNFITRAEGIARLRKIVDFLALADRHHGAWPHWMNGSTGRTIAFSTKDNGGDLVETSFMAAGLITARQYLNPEAAEEAALAAKINTLLDQIEWSWYTRSGQKVLYWHWSPNYGWDMNMQVRGYNEALITYIMAATSTSYPIGADVYHQGWARSGSIVNGKTFYGIRLPVGFDYGGPLFFAHYSFLGLDPNNLSDRYADYWEQQRNHSLINLQHCILNPRNHVGYSENCWGLTASDDPDTGYAVHEPTRDNGTITPSAALSSIPYTPEESMRAMRFFYHILGDKLWGPYGFYDAFNPGKGWWASSYLAIDQGPIIIMIENHRSALCWNLFMSAPEVQAALDKLQFVTN